MNIGRGVPVSVVDLVNALSTIEGRDLDPELAPRRLGEVQDIHLDAARAQAELGWQARTGDSRRGSRSRSTRCAEPQRRTARLPA